MIVWICQIGSKVLRKYSPTLIGTTAAFFSECSKNCVDGGVLSIYRKLYKDANGDMDVFFQMANELPGVKSEIVEKGRVYHLIACHIYILKSYPNLQSDADHGN